MSDLAWWLRRELERRALSQNAAAVHAGVAVATVSAILNKGHIPKVETLFRLADYFETPRDQVLRLAGYQVGASAGATIADSFLGGTMSGMALAGRTGETVGAAPHERLGLQRTEILEEELLEEFRRLPDELKEAAVQHVAVLIRLAQRPPFRIIGDDDEETPGEEQTDETTEPRAA
jgi:transcriptional regulator with XRE-family HTH domain